MYQDTLIVYSSDNGGVLDGTNFPLRETQQLGGRHARSSFCQRRVCATKCSRQLEQSHNAISMIGIQRLPRWLEPRLRTTLLCPHSRPYHQSLGPTLYGNASFPPVDGVNIWPFITNLSANPDPGAAHPSLVLSKQVLISKGRWKLLVAQPHFKTQNNGWKDRTEYGENRMRTRRSQPAWDKTPRRVRSILSDPRKSRAFSLPL